MLNEDQTSRVNENLSEDEDDKDIYYVVNLEESFMPISPLHGYHFYLIGPDLATRLKSLYITCLPLFSINICHSNCPD